MATARRGHAERLGSSETLLNPYRPRLSTMLTMGGAPTDFDTMRRRWLACARKEDHNSIAFQLYQIVWRSGVYRIIRKANENPPLDEQQFPIQSEMLARFIRGCFFESQAVALRRVIGSRADSECHMDARRGVWSLRSLLGELRRNRALLTRSNLLRDTDPKFDIDRQARIDWLTGTSVATRRDDDLVRDEVLTELDDHLGRTVDRVQSWVDKAVAHAASEASREVSDFEFGRLSYQDMIRTEEQACRAFAFINRYLLRNEGLSFLPVMLGGEFHHAEVPLIPAHRIPELEDDWEESRSLTIEWAMGDWQPDWPPIKRA